MYLRHKIYTERVSCEPKVTFYGDSTVTLPICQIKVESNSQSREDLLNELKDAHVRSPPTAQRSHCLFSYDLNLLFPICMITLFTFQMFNAETDLINPCL